MVSPTSSLLRYALAFGGGSVLGAAIINKAMAEADDSNATLLERIPAVTSGLTSHSSLTRFGKPHRISPGTMCYTNHCLEFDPQRKTPIWVAEHISRDKIAAREGAANRKNSKFRPDPRLPAEIRTSNEDFWDSGWSRGHMAPAGDNKFSQQSMDDTFLLSNIVPQDIDNNGDFWNRLEIFCRDLTKKYSDVWVVSGPLWLARERKDSVDNPGRAPTASVVDENLTQKRPRNKIMYHEVIGANDVSVPTHLYKVVLTEDAEKLERPLLSAFIVPNKPIRRNKKLDDYRVPLSQLEKHVGYRFFRRLDRSRTDDLCEVDGCEMMDYRAFQSYFVTRGIGGARNIKDLERYWRKAKDLDLVSPDIQAAYEEKKLELIQRANKEGDQRLVARAA